MKRSRLFELLQVHVSDALKSPHCVVCRVCLVAMETELWEEWWCDYGDESNITSPADVLCFSECSTSADVLESNSPLWLRIVLLLLLKKSFIK